MAEPVRIVLADDHAVLRAGLRAMLELKPEFEVVGEASTGEETVALARSLRPDVVVMDLSMPGMSGLDATRRIVALELPTRILVLTAHAEEEYVLPVLDAGASGYVTKTSADQELIDAVRTVTRGEVFLQPSAASLMVRRYRAVESGAAGNPLSRLTAREREVLCLTAEGYSSPEIGERLFISPKTVDTYRARLMHKLGLTHRAELVRLALSTGLLRSA